MSWQHRHLRRATRLACAIIVALTILATTGVLPAVAQVSRAGTGDAPTVDRVIEALRACGFRPDRRRRWAEPLPTRGGRRVTVDVVTLFDRAPARQRWDGRIITLRVYGSRDDAAAAQADMAVRDPARSITDGSVSDDWGPTMTNTTMGRTVWRGNVAVAFSDEMTARVATPPSAAEDDDRRAPYAVDADIVDCLEAVVRAPDHFPPTVRDSKWRQVAEAMRACLPDLLITDSDDEYDFGDELSVSVGREPEGFLIGPIRSNSQYAEHWSDRDIVLVFARYGVGSERPEPMPQLQAHRNRVISCFMAVPEVPPDWTETWP